MAFGKFFWAKISVARFKIVENYVKPALRKKAIKARVLDV